MLKWFDLATEPRLAGTENLYTRNGYFNFIPREKLRKYTRVTDVSVENNSVFVGCENPDYVNCAIIFCTYKREKYIVGNVNYLLQNLQNISDFEWKIIVVDNARTLSQSDFSGDVALVGNDNNGGSGGFKRGMETAAQIGGFTHFVLMDDDVEIEFTAIQKMLNFLRFLKPEYKDLSIAGSMLYMDKPAVQFEAGGHFGKDGSQKPFGHFLDLNKPENLELNERENDINYGGWWLMCMPFKLIEDGNFPLPFFLKYDDVEYALRNKLRIITLNGVGVWHEKFEAKYNSASEYYNTRNYLHLCALHCDNFNSRRWVKKQIRAKRVRQQYKMVEAVRLGYEDFLRGLEWLKNLNAEENHRRICALNYEFLSYDEIGRRYGIRPEDGKFYPVPSGKRRLIFGLGCRKNVYSSIGFSIRRYSTSGQKWSCIAIVRETAGMLQRETADSVMVEIYENIQRAFRTAGFIEDKVGQFPENWSVDAESVCS